MFIITLNAYMLSRLPIELKRRLVLFCFFGILTPRVVDGLFKGLKYIWSIDVGSAFYPKILGSYEKEIAGVFSSEIKSGIKCFMNIGAAEGYYAIGAAFINPNIEILAYEMNESYSKQIKELAKINKINSRIQIRGKCDPLIFKRDLETHNGKKLLLIDVEGYESELLDVEKIPPLKYVTCIVEIHNNDRRNLLEQIIQRFQNTHSHAIIANQARDIDYYRRNKIGGRMVPDKWKLQLILERSYPTPWLYLKPFDTCR